MNEAFFSYALSTIIKMTLTGSIITLLLFFVKPIIKNRLPKLFQYYTWLIVIGAFIIPFSKYIILPYETTIFPITSLSETVEQYVITEQGSDNLQEATIQLSDNEIQLPETKFPFFMEITSGLTLLFYIWFLGILIFLGINLFGYFSFVWKILQNSSPARNEETSMLATLHKRPPVLYRNKLAPTPMLIGVIHPIIILPDKKYTPIQLKYILHHELIHYRRKDVLLKWIVILANAIHWFNPIIYLVRHELNHMCELACDEKVIKHLTVSEKQEYGNTLISVVAEKKLPNSVLSTTMSQEKKALKERLGAIMNNKNTTRKALIISVLLFAIILCTTIVIGASKSNKDSKSKWDDFPNTLVENGFLSPDIVNALPDHRVEKESDGSTLYLWNQWNDSEGIFIHKIELNVLNDELQSYIYTDYFFNATFLDSPLSIQEGTEMVERFATMFITDNTLKFVNEPAYFSRYDEGHVESWVAEDGDIEHIIMVDLDIGCIIFYHTQPKSLDSSIPDDPTPFDISQLEDVIAAEKEALIEEVEKQVHRIFNAPVSFLSILL